MPRRVNRMSDLDGVGMHRPSSPPFLADLQRIPASVLWPDADDFGLAGLFWSADEPDSGDGSPELDFGLLAAGVQGDGWPLKPSAAQAAAEHPQSQGRPSRPHRMTELQPRHLRIPPPFLADLCTDFHDFGLAGLFSQPESKGRADDAHDRDGLAGPDFGLTALFSPPESKGALGDLVGVDFGLAALFTPPESKGTTGDPHSEEGLAGLDFGLAASPPDTKRTSGDPRNGDELAGLDKSYFSSEEEAEDNQMDREALYFKALVSKFIAAVYPKVKNGAVATGPGQQDAAITPGASAGGMAAEGVARLMKKPESNEAAATSRSAVANQIRMVTCERWTWKNQTTVDGADGLTVMSRPKKQPNLDTCMPTAAAVVMETNLRVQHNKDCLLSLDHMIALVHDSKTTYPKRQPMVRLLLQLKFEGVLSEHDYKNPQTAGSPLRYRIKEFLWYNVADFKDMVLALYSMRRRGPLMGVLNISPNYDECAITGQIYKYDPKLLKEGEEIKTHAVCIMCFGIEGGLPYLECQSTHGDNFSEYLKIDVSSLCQLWSIVIDEEHM